jgi:hypothetical protein
MIQKGGTEKLTERRRLSENSGYEGSITVGKDILELLSSSMYVSPLTIYREYVQNSADAIDQAVEQGILATPNDGRIDIALDHIGRRSVVRDNGIGLDRDELVSRMTAFGASQKRWTSARGFRGVGRLAGLGYCQELIFRSRTKSSSKICEVRWDCRSLKNLLSDPNFDGDLEDTVRQIVNVREYSDVDAPDRFFEVEIIKPKRLGNDLLLNELAIQHYLSQIGPCPFRPDFGFGEQIRDLLKPANVKDYGIFLNEADEPVYRPYSDRIEYSDTRAGLSKRLQGISIENDAGETAAIGWVLHHDYQGALPPNLGMRGLRARVGNIQVGNERILAKVFPEERFCSWTIAEVHVIDKRVLPNGRRDNFEPSSHFSNIVTHLIPRAAEIARQCRSSSVLRNRLKTFELGEQKVLEKMEIIEQGAISRNMVTSLKKEIGSHLSEMQKAFDFNLFDDVDKNEMRARADELDGRIKGITNRAAHSDIFQTLSRNKRAAYREVFDLIYECSVNRIAAKSLVDRILARSSNL